MKKLLNLLPLMLLVLVLPLPGRAATLLQENFDDANFTSRGWYDSPSGTIDTTNHIPGSTASYKCEYLAGANGCSGGAPNRHLFTPSNSVYISYWVKHSSNWVGSGVSYHPHMIYVLTNMNGSYDGLAYDHLTAYVEENSGYPVMSIQDGQNIDMSRIGQNLIGVTENRSVAGCNGTQPNIGQSEVSCYQSGSVYWNGTVWKGPTAFFYDSTQKTNWHFVEAYFQLNSVVNGIGQPDGIIQYWYDGQLQINHTNVIIRTGANANMQFDQLVIGPYIGNGSPVDQTFWFDNMTVATARPASGTATTPAAPTNLTLQ